MRNVHDKSCILPEDPDMFALDIPHDSTKEGGGANPSLRPRPKRRAGKKAKGSVKRKNTPFPYKRGRFSKTWVADL